MLYFMIFITNREIVLDRNWLHSIIVINGNYMMQGSLTVAGHKFVRSLPDQRSLRSYEKKAEQLDSPKICHCRILTRMECNNA